MRGAAEKSMGTISASGKIALMHSLMQMVFIISHTVQYGNQPGCRNG